MDFRTCIFRHSAWCCEGFWWEELSAELEGLITLCRELWHLAPGVSELKERKQVPVVQFLPSQRLHQIYSFCEALQHWRHQHQSGFGGESRILTSWEALLSASASNELFQGAPLQLMLGVCSCIISRGLAARACQSLIIESLLLSCILFSPAFHLKCFPVNFCFKCWDCWSGLGLVLFFLSLSTIWPKCHYHSRFMYWNDHMWTSFFRGWESSLNVYSSQPV